MIKHKRWLPLLSVLILVCATALAGADTAMPWLGQSPLSAQKVADVSDRPPSFNGNYSCAEENHNGCLVNTPYGAASQNSTVRLNSSSSFGQIIALDNQPHTLPIPGSNTIISYANSPGYGLYVFFTRNFTASINKSQVGNDIRYQVNRLYDVVLSDKNHHWVPVDTTSINYSNNGEWMVVVSPNLAVLRVNLETFEVLPFGGGFNYSVGLSPAPKTAISDDGRYAVVASSDFNSFTLYDLGTCGPAPSTINAPTNCQSRDLQAPSKAQIPGFMGVSNINFINNNLVSFYASYKDASVQKLAKFIISNPSQGQSRIDYLALGDSYISGEGAFDYLAGTDIATNKCHLSKESYPNLLINHQLLQNSHSVACSGAKIKDINDGTLAYNQKFSQASGKEETVFDPEIYDNFLPGYRAQLNFISQYQPGAITVSIGGNDIGFSNILKRCLEPDSCYSSYEDRLELVREINGQFDNFVSTYKKIKAAGDPSARVYVIGYPQIAKVNGDCGENVHLSLQEIQFASQMTNYLDTVLKAAAANAGVFYVDTEHALDGSKLCETSSGAVNGITAGDDTGVGSFKPFGNESFHPNKLGHRLLELSILNMTNNLKELMPTENSASTFPVEANLDILNAPRTNRPIYKVNYDDDLTNDVQIRGGVWNVTIEGAKYGIKGLQSVKAVLNSDPLELGTYYANALGDLNISLPAPVSVPVGFHTLHIYATNINGDQIDIQKVVYVGASSDDLDGNGTFDSLQQCFGFPASSHDVDQDGIDDACDPTLGPPPTPVQQTSVNSGAAKNADVQLLTTRILQDIVDMAPVAKSFIKASATSDYPDLKPTAAAYSAVPGSAVTKGKVLGAATTKDKPHFNAVYYYIVIVALVILGAAILLVIL
jgi:lysophospholipase L1-like esterase